MGLNLVHIFLLILAAERGLELILARRNEILVRNSGGREYGAAFSELIVAFHACWFAAFALEAAIRGAVFPDPPVAPVLTFLFLQAVRYWCIASLGKFWNTRIIVLPNAKLVRTGPYRWIKHPNYAVVLLEIFLYPMLCGCWITALIFGTANVFILKKRIQQEDGALSMLSG
jgi:methyltransferase